MLAATSGGAGNLDHFSSLQVVGLSEVKPWWLKDYADVIFGFLAEFDRCFKKFNNLKPQFALFATPFDPDAKSVSEEFQMEVLDLKCDKQKYTDMGVPDFYNFFQKKVSKISLCSLQNSLMAMFGCTYTYTFVNSSSHQ